MNFFSVLDDSDNDEPKVAKTAAPAAATSAPKKNDGHPEEKYRVVKCND